MRAGVGGGDVQGMAPMADLVHARYVVRACERGARRSDGVWGRRDLGFALQQMGQVKAEAR